METEPQTTNEQFNAGQYVGELACTVAMWDTYYTDSAQFPFAD